MNTNAYVEEDDIKKLMKNKAVTITEVSWT